MHTLVVKSVSTFGSQAEELKEMSRAAAVELHESDHPLCQAFLVAYGW